MNRWEKLLPASAFPGASALAWPAGEPAPELPAGKAGIAVYVRTRRTDSGTFMYPKAVGVDGQPVWSGVGRMVAIVDPGQHLVEVMGKTGVDTTRSVFVPSGQIVTLDYRMPKGLTTTPGVLVPSPGTRRMGSGYWGILSMFLVVAACAGVNMLVDSHHNRTLFNALVVAVLIGMPTAPWLVGRIKRGVDQRYRAAVSYEARGDVSAAVVGMFLGDGPCPSTVADTDHGALVVTATAEREYVPRGPGFGTRTTDAHAWVPWPTLSIDGQRRPLSWRIWCYRLTPGSHDITITPQAPPAGPQNEPPTVTADPATVRVTIEPGQVTHLQVLVKAIIEVRPCSRDPRRVTELIAFHAQVNTRLTNNEGS